MVEPLPTNVELPSLMGNADNQNGLNSPIVSSGDSQGKSPNSLAKRRKTKPKKSQKKGQRSGIMSLASATATVMGVDEIEEHAEAMDMI